MKSQFSEFTYGYTLVEELSRSLKFSAVPTFPSLIEEGRAGGYDVKLKLTGLPLFLQFKLSDYLATKTAKYYDTFNEPYYRFSLTSSKRSKQHNLLLNLEGTGSMVFYVAPKFHEYKEFSKNYFNSLIMRKSIWVSPKEIDKLPDDKEHYVCFNSSLSKVYFCSQPKKINPSKFNNADDLIKYANQLENSQESNWEKLYKQMEDIFRKEDPESLREFSKMIPQEDDIVLKISKLANIAFGAYLLVY